LSWRWGAPLCHRFLKDWKHLYPQLQDYTHEIHIKRNSPVACVSIFAICFLNCYWLFHCYCWVWFQWWVYCSQVIGFSTIILCRIWEYGLHAGTTF
jgi:hypothetical protein